METSKIEAMILEQIQSSPKLQKLVPDELLSFAVTGLNEESGEVAGLLCREIYKKIPMRDTKWIEELGDVLWYLTAVCLCRGYTLEKLFKENTNKLVERYGEFHEQG